MEKIKIHGETFEFDSKVKSLQMRGSKEVLYLSKNDKIVGYTKIETEKDNYLIINHPCTGIPFIFKVGGKILLRENDLYKRLSEEQKKILFMLINNFSTDCPIDKDFIITELEKPERNNFGISIPCLILDIEGVKLNTGISIEDLGK